MFMPYTPSMFALAGTTTSARAARPRRTTRADVLSAACRVLDRSGSDGLTMAAVADELGLTTMALYRHVDSRSDLVAGAVDLVLGEWSAAAPVDAPWADGVVAWMTEVRTLMLAHPWVASQIGTDDTIAPGWLDAIVRLMRTLDGSSLTTAARASAVVWVTRVTMGIVSQEIRAPLPGVAAEPELLLDMVDAADRDLVRAAMRHVRTVSNDELFTTLLVQTRQFLRSLPPRSAHA